MRIAQDFVGIGSANVHRRTCLRTFGMHVQALASTFQGGQYHQEVLATNGILQGCPLSVVLLNALVAVWFKAVELDFGGAEAVSYADDTQALVRA